MNYFINEEIADDDMDNFINEEIADDNMDKFNYGLMQDDDIFIDAVGLCIKSLYKKQNLKLKGKNKNQAQYFFEKIRLCRVQTWRLGRNFTGYTCM